MVSPVVLAVAAVGCFLALAHAAVTTSGPAFRRTTGAMAALAILLIVVSPAAGVALLAPVLLSRRLANAPVPANVDELFRCRRESADR